MNLLTRFTRNEMKEQFDRVADKQHWKNPIDATVSLTPRERAVLCEAVVFFTGSVPTVEKVGFGVYRITAAGYFAAVGA